MSRVPDEMERDSYPAHDSLTGGHMSDKKTTEKRKKDYFGQE